MVKELVVVMDEIRSGIAYIRIIKFDADKRMEDMLNDLWVHVSYQPDARLNVNYESVLSSFASE